MTVLEMLATHAPDDKFDDFMELATLKCVHGPPMNPVLVAHLLSAAVGSEAGWTHLLEMRPNLISQHRGDMASILAILFSEELTDD